jgi:pyruvate/2-oxoglutarate dehydrogenase complex dihydrolipoamide acyltransferase (E2) component
VPADVVMPKLGLTMAAGTIARWLKQPGESVREGEPLLEVATDKISYEVESPASGTIARIVGRDGEEFACGAVVGVIALEGESPDTEPSPLRASAGNGVVASDTAETARIIASPAARRLARERGVPLRVLVGTGPRGRITLSDVGGYVSPAAPAPAAPASAALPPLLPPERRAIYRKMTAVAQLPLAQVETTVRVDAVKALIDARGDFGWTAFVVFALARLLREHPALRTDASTGAPFEALSIGIAADTPQGLIVPVVRDADTLPLAAVQQEVLRLANAARAGSLGPHEINGACFSLSNVGPQGVERVVPVPDPPQTAILGIGAVTQRPAVVHGALVPAWMLSCVLSFDHRFIDGAPAARFLAAFAQACADPGLLL